MTKGVLGFPMAVLAGVPSFWGGVLALVLVTLVVGS